MVKYIEKLNKTNKTYSIEEKVILTNGSYTGTLEHDNPIESSINVYTGEKLTGEKIRNIILTIPENQPWKRNIKIFSDYETLYISYETVGDQIEAEDINLLQDDVVRIDNSLNEYKNFNDKAVDVIRKDVETLESVKADITYTDKELLKKADKTNTYTKEQTDARIKEVVGVAPEALDTLQEIASSLNNDANFAGTMTDSLSKKVDKVSGKQLSTNDYTTDEKTKLAGVETGANKYIHPTSHPASIINEDEFHRFVSDTEKSDWNAKETITGSQEKADKTLSDAKEYAFNAVHKSTSTTVNPNETKSSYYVCKHENTPDSSIFWHIMTYFYTSDREKNRTQIAISYNANSPRMAFRSYVLDKWTEWVSVDKNNSDHLTDVISHITATERTEWNAKETTTGSQTKANKALIDAKAYAQNAVSVYDGGEINPNTTTESLILSKHENTPNAGLFWYIQTFFYSSRTGNRGQMALSYALAKPRIAYRTYKAETGWTNWVQIDEELKAHINDKNIHVTSEEKARWDSVAEASGAINVLNSDNTMRNLGKYHSEKTFSLIANSDKYWLNDTTQEVCNIRIPYLPYANIKVSLSGDDGGVRIYGLLEGLYSFGANSTNKTLLNSLIITNSIGYTASEISLGTLYYDSATNEIVIPVYKKEKRSPLTIKLEIFSKSDSTLNSTNGSYIEIEDDTTTTPLYNQTADSISNSVEIKDIRKENTTQKTPIEYRKQGKRRVYHEFISSTFLNLQNIIGNFATLETIIPWNDTSGGQLTQYAHGANGTLCMRSSTGTLTNEVWGSWVIIAKKGIDVSVLDTHTKNDNIHVTKEQKNKLASLTNDNLLLNSQTPIYKPASATQNYNYAMINIPPNIITVGETYTFSAEISSTTDDFQKIVIYPYPKGVNGAVTVNVIDNKVTLTFTVIESGMDSILVYAGINGYTAGKDITVFNYKLEKGSIATAWTKNPNDGFTWNNLRGVK